MQDEKTAGAADAAPADVENLFIGSQETYEEAQARTAEENKGFAKTEFFRMEKFGTYRLRILPVAPSADGTIDRKSYEYPVHQMLLEIRKPSQSAKPEFVYANVTRATDAGLPMDLIDTYRKLAVAQAKSEGEDKLAEKIAGGSFGGGLKYSYLHCMYIFDMDERGKGVQLLTLSHSQFKDLDDRKFNLWQKKLAKNPKHPCPVSSVKYAYPVEIEKKKNGSKTEYAVGIDNESDPDELSLAELTLLMNAPRIPEIVLRYSRYQFEATLEFLKQCDAKYGMQIMETDEMKEAAVALEAELPKEDTSTFSFDKRGKDAKESAEEDRLTLDVLFDRFARLQELSLGDKTEEGQELRGMIRAFIEQEKLPVRVTRTTTNQMLLEMLEEALENVPDPAGTPDTGDSPDSFGTEEGGPASAASKEPPRRRR